MTEFRKFFPKAMMAAKCYGMFLGRAINSLRGVPYTIRSYELNFGGYGGRAIARLRLSRNRQRDTVSDVIRVLVVF